INFKLLRAEGLLALRAVKSPSRSPRILCALCAGALFFYSVYGFSRRPSALARRYRVGDPGAVAAAGIGAFDGDAAGFEPQRDRALAPAVDPVDHRDLRTALEPRRHLRDDRIDRVARHRKPGLGGHQRHAP